MWENIHLQKIDSWTESANILIDNINRFYCNGGIKILKYKIMDNNSYISMIKGNNYWENRKIFVENISVNKIVLEDRAYLDLDNKFPKIKIKDQYTDIYSLSGNLARIMGHGGAYKKAVDSNFAWKVATEFVENEFENRFEDFDLYEVVIENSKWFFDVAWDYSFIIVDKINNEIIFMDLTDTD